MKGAEDNESEMEEVVIAGVKIGGKIGGIGGGISGTGGCSNSTGASGLESPGLYGSSAKKYLLKFLNYLIILALLAKYHNS